jgi:plasmid stability protein
MLTIQLRNLPESLYLAIKQSALVSKRSMTKEAIFLIENSLNQKNNGSVEHSPKLVALAELKKLAQSDLPKLSLNEINNMISEDRQR